MKKFKIVLAFMLCFSFLAIQPANAATIKLNKTSIYLVEDETYQLKVSGTKKKITWKSSKKSVATVTSKGKVTGKSEGSATIYAKVSGKTLKCKVVVEEPQISADEAKILVGESAPLFLWNADHGTITWSSDDEDIVTVDEDGWITAKKSGTADILAKYHKQYFWCEVTVIDLEESYAKVKNAVLNSKRVDDDGNHYLGMKTTQNFTHEDCYSNCSIYYLEDTDQVKFVYSEKIVADEYSNYQDKDLTVCMYLNILNDENATITFEDSEYNNGVLEESSGTAIFNATEYYDGDEIDFDIKGSTNTTVPDDISTHLLSWDIYLLAYCDSSLCELGMLNYE